MRVGSREWWLAHVESRNKEGIAPIFRVDDEVRYSFLKVDRLDAGTPRRFAGKPEAELAETFLSFGLIREDSSTREERVRFGGREGHADFVGEGFDGSKLVTEFEVVEKEHEIGEKAESVFFRKMGEGMGQALLYSGAFRRKYPSQGWTVLPAVCTWTLGTGSSEVIGLCRGIGLTVMELGSPFHYRDGSGLRIHYLADGDSRKFQEVT